MKGEREEQKSKRPLFNQETNQKHKHNNLSHTKEQLEHIIKVKIVTEDLKPLLVVWRISNKKMGGKLESTASLEEDSISTVACLDIVVA